MATRALIKVENFTVCAFYKHWDGYPEATVAWLKEFNEAFTKQRGDDPQYKMAQLIRSSALMQAKFELDPSATTGWGVVEHDVDMGQDYTYVLKTDGSVTHND